MGSMLNTIADYLITQSWQFSVVFGLVLAGTLALRKASAHWRYLLWLVVIAKCLMLPVVSLPLAVIPQNVERNQSERNERVSPSLTRIAEIESSIDNSNSITSPTLNPDEPATALAGVRVSSSADMNHFSVRTCLVIAWMLVVGMFLTYVFADVWVTHRRLTRTRFLADDEIRSTLATLSDRLGIRRTPTVYQASTAAQPFVWGWLRGDIYLPLYFTNTGSPEQQQAILAHELAHVARWDAAVNLIQIIVQALFFFNPLVWWMNKNIRQEREKCCDEVVLSALGTPPRIYCEAIVDMLALEYKARHTTPTLAVTGSTKNIEERITTILTPHRKFRRRPSFAAVVTLMIVAVGVLPTALVLTTRAETPARSDKQRLDTQNQADSLDAWQTDQVMDFGIINAQTREPIPGVSLELQNAGPGIDFQDIKVQTTDTNGRSPVKLPNHPPTAVRVYPSKPGFVPLRVYWAEEPFPNMPKSITIPMEPGKVFGGVIRNERGEAIPDVAITVHYWGTGSGDNPHVRANIDTKTTSDKHGRWQVEIMPAKINEDRLRIFLSHPDYISDHLKRGFIPMPVTERPALGKLFDQTAVMTMRKGETIQGRVVDEDGRPIANASLYDSDYYWFSPKKPRAKTGQNGDFRILGVKPGPLNLTIQATGYAPEFIDVRRASSPLKIQLKPGQTIHGRVVDENQKPVAETSIYAVGWRKHRDRLNLRAKTDTHGKFRLTDAPLDAVEYNVMKEGYMVVENLSLSPSPDEYSVVMKSPLRITGSVVDAETKKPLAKFTMMRGTDYDDGRAPQWMRYDQKTITNGEYETTIVQENFLYRIRVEAEGYLPGESRIFRAYDPDKGEVTYDFKLNKAAPLTGTVVGLDGEPLADAEVYLATQPIYINNRKINSDGESLSSKTDEAGRFEFPPEIEPFCLVAVHEQGVGIINEKEFKSSPHISIGPWTAKNERLQIIRRPAPGQHSDFP